MDGDDQAQSYGSFSGGDGDGEDGEHHAGERFGMRPIAPEGDQVEVGRVQHQLNADENENGVAADQSAGQADGEQQGCDEKIGGERRHWHPLFLVHGDNDRANGCRGEQQCEDFKRQHVAAHQRDCRCRAP
jgi:hypothetical protein